MFKRKSIYIILLIVFTLLLCGDVTGYILIANASSGSTGTQGGPGQMQGGFDGVMPSDGTMPDFGSGSMPSDGTMPDFDGAMPSDGTMPQWGDGSMPQTSDDASAEASGGTNDMQGFERPDWAGTTGRTAAVSGFASFISGWWIPIGIFCVLVDAFCVFMLIRISRKAKQGTEEASRDSASEEPVKERKPQVSGYEKRRRKRRRTIEVVSILLAIVLVIVLGYSIIQSMYAAQVAKEEAVPVVSAEAADAEMTTAISGTGTLTDADAEEVTIPNEVKISAYYVENGDIVAAGDVLAAVDHTSVMKAIADLQDAMDLLDAQIEDASSDAIASKVTASVDGRVKVIYAQEDTGVADTMYDDGALLLISLDGLMAADIETDADLTAGNSVIVRLADGTEEKGRVDSVSEGVVSVTVSDDGTDFGEEVTVLDESGTTLGSGTLYIHSELKVTGYTGTVLKIKCSENEEVSAGDTLLTLTDTEYTADYNLLLEKRSDYEEEMMTLFTLYQDGSLYAEYAGTVSGIDEDAAASMSTSAAVSDTDYSLASKTVASLETTNRMSSAVELGNNPSGADDATVTAYTNYAATVSKVAYSAITVLEYPTSLSITDYSSFSALGVTSAMMTSETALSPSASTPVYMYKDGAWASYSVDDISAGDVLILTYDPSAGSDPLWIIIASKGESQSSGGYSGGSHTSGSTTSSTTEEEEVEPEDLYAISETKMMSLTPRDAVSVTITVDELDILALEEGQEATITLDALQGQTFTGSVTDIDVTGTNSGGSTKYTAVVTLDRTTDMLAGMNAAVSITLSQAESEVTIPVAALMESETGTYVYTSYNKEEGTLGTPMNVTTGLSDGTSVEILSGLSAGDTVYYTYDDTVDVSSSSVSSSGSGFNLMRILGGRG